ncbi:MAG TPA: sigma-54-dependent Fis family transcriptional regulator [Deltaproteobacteria bacterium]|nr:sigma-54-dependent Fis family transcriptional regulator [Deltaproteobacteria bacterium]
MILATQRLDSATYEKIFEISKRILAQMNLDRLLDLILDEAILLSGAERGFIVLNKPEGIEVQSARNMDKESLKKARDKVSMAIVKEVTQTQQAVLTLDAGEDAKLRDSESVHRMKLRSILCVPLKSGEEIQGVLYLDNRFASGVFQESHAHIVSVFADQASLGIAHASLLEENRRRQKELENNQKVILRLNKALEEKVADQAHELEKARLMLEAQELNAPRADRYEEIIGEAHVMKEVLKTLDRIIDSDVTVYIHGESGTGKELIARALHFNGLRRNHIYVSTNCASYSETLLESELFGHVRGAFTGAEKDKKGIFEYADGGTVFLDEVADMSPGMQAKLLRVLQEGEIRPLGSNRSAKVNVRIISASNKDLGELVKQGKFRKDLFYRLNVVRLDLPALRDRKTDIPKLVDHFMKKNKMGIPPNFLFIEPSALKALMTYDWPGNIRELENEVNRAMVMGKGSITRDLLSDGVREKYEFEEEMLRDLNLDRQVSGFEKRIVERALLEAQGNKVKASKLLGISRFTLHQKIRQLQIEAPKRRVTPEEVAQALKECKGNKALAARKLGIQRQTLYHKLDRFGESEE